jgi:hypothetical protein
MSKSSACHVESTVHAIFIRFLIPLSRNVKFSDSGVYFCVAENRIGKLVPDKEQVARLVVKSKFFSFANLYMISGSQSAWRDYRVKDTIALQENALGSLKDLTM